MEVGCRAFVAGSTIRLMKKAGIRGQTQWKALMELGSVADKSSHWLWPKQNAVK